ncbi:hypothetical protein B296_00037705 [Ensete ventricosum]|uniref:Uncharacterized protein n=1 Tax=Ensete ventricosum TaxID=4639 RepID=A0A426ZHL8_ENSVE|nr:hypothetical protein B296_00037705 [Ensete ventricosum]
MVVVGLSISDQKNRDGRRPIKNACMTNEGCASGTPRILAVKQVTNWAKGLSSFWLNLISEATGWFVSSQLRLGLDGRVRGKLQRRRLGVRRRDREALVGVCVPDVAPPMTKSVCGAVGEAVECQNSFMELARRSTFIPFMQDRPYIASLMAVASSIGLVICFVRRGVSHSTSYHVMGVASYRVLLLVQRISRDPG